MPWYTEKLRPAAGTVLESGGWWNNQPVTSHHLASVHTLSWNPILTNDWQELHEQNLTIQTHKAAGRKIPPLQQKGTLHLQRHLLQFEKQATTLEKRSQKIHSLVLHAPEWAKERYPQINKFKHACLDYPAVDLKAPG